jgi:hypothetical protein
MAQTDLLWLIFGAVVIAAFLVLSMLSGIAKILEKLPDEIERARLHLEPAEYERMKSDEYEISIENEKMELFTEAKIKRETKSGA